jgi:hypothetical protein
MYVPRNGIRLGFVKTSEFRGARGLNPPTPPRYATGPHDVLCLVLRINRIISLNSVNRLLVVVMWTLCVSCAVGTEFFSSLFGWLSGSGGIKHIAKPACDLSQRCGWEVKDHPAYILELAPCGCDFFESPGWQGVWKRCRREASSHPMGYSHLTPTCISCTPNYNLWCHDGTRV